MNKILVSNKENNILNTDNYIFKKDEVFNTNIDNIEKNISFIASDNTNVVVNIFSKNSHINLDIQVLENATLTLNIFSIFSVSTITASLDKPKAKYYLNYSTLNNKNSNNKIYVYHKSSYTESYLKNHGVSIDNSNLIFDVSAYIPKTSSKCISKQDNQIIENGPSFSQINPNLYIENYDIDASHSAYVGEFKEEELFYLMSRGISEKDSKFLLLQAFLIGIFKLDSDDEDKYTNEIINCLKGV